LLEGEETKGTHEVSDSKGRKPGPTENSDRKKEEGNVKKVPEKRKKSSS